MFRGNNKIILVLAGFCFLVGCASSRPFDPARKIPKEQLQKDFQVFRHVLEEGHPSLYWYTSKDSMDHFFDLGYARITGPMTEPAFRMLLSYVISKMNCGHTSSRYSRTYSRYLDTVRMKQFPLSIKFWGDSAVIYANLNRKDSVLRRGTLLRSINGKPIGYYRDSLFQFLSMDGHGVINKYQTLSNLGVFSGWYRNIFGLSDKFVIGYTNNRGVDGTVTIPVFDPKKDTSRSEQLANFKKIDRRERRQLMLSQSRKLEFDSSTSAAILTVNTFLRGNGLNRFIKKSFKTLRKKHTRKLVVDVRMNTGGNVDVSNLLTRFLVDHPYKIADSLYAISRTGKYGKYIQHNFFNRLSMLIISKKKADGKYHFGYFEKHYFKPKKRNHFNGSVYIITGGNSFSATALFAGVMKGQKNVVLAGEETGGGAYGNTAWVIPDVTLPYSKVRFTLPRFRLVIDKDAPKTGRGVMPDVWIDPSREMIIKGLDAKMEKVREMISEPGLKD